MAFQRRVLKLFLFACLGMGLIWARMLQLQVLERDAWVAAAKAKHQRYLELPAPRGRILDAGGRVLAVDEPVYHLAVVAWNWQRRMAVRCTACGALHHHLADSKPRSRCSCGEPDAALEVVPLPDVGPLEDLLELRTGEIAERCEERLERIRVLVDAKRLHLEQQSKAEFLIDDEVRQYRRDLLHRPKVIARRLPPEAVRLVELDEVGRYHGLLIRSDLRRSYPAGGPASQLLGYVSVIVDEDELGRYQRLYGDHVTLDTRVGRTGVEHALEPVLLGHKGWERQQRDADGAYTVTVGAEAPRRGSEVRLALTARACLEAEAALKKYDDPLEYFPGTAASGGFVALDADTGAVLAWGEMPRLDLEDGLARMIDDAHADAKAVFDPDLGQWVLPEGEKPPVGETLEAWRKRLSKPAPVHFSRVSQVAVEPGSTFKVFIGLGMLEGLSLLPPGTLLPHEGSFHCNGKSGKPKCHRHRDVGFEGAIEVSCNPFFSYSVRRRPRYWEVWRGSIPVLLQGLGFGRPTGVEVRAESEGTLLRDYIDFSLLDTVGQVMARVRKERGLTSGQMSMRVEGRVPSLVAGRGPERLAPVIEKTLVEALAVAGPRGRVVLTIKPVGQKFRLTDYRFEAVAQFHPQGPAPRVPDVQGLRERLGVLGVGLDVATPSPGLYTFGYTLSYHDRVGRKAGEPLIILEDDGLNFAIGQGPISVTPIQMARAVATFANGGRLVTPRVAATADGVAQDVPPTDLGLDPQSIRRVRAGMRAVVEGPQGTARLAAWREVPATVYGKTGTSQVGGWWRQGGETDGEGPWHHWFVGFAEREGFRTIAFACVLHARREGAASRTSIHAACRFLKWWFTEGPDARRR